MTEEGGLDFVNHLDELRKRFIITALTAIAAGVVSFFFSDFLVQVITAPIRKSISNLYFLSPYDAFLIKLKISLVSGVILSSPVIFTQLWQFVSPGLYLNERKIVLPLILVSTLLFLIGVSVAYFLVVPFALNFFLGFQTPSLLPLISISSYVSFFLSLILVFGIVFNFPVILVGLISLKVVGLPFLRAQRKVVIVLILIAAAILTPTVDIFTQILLAAALWMLFEVSLLIGWGLERSRKKVDS